MLSFQPICQDLYDIFMTVDGDRYFNVVREFVRVFLTDSWVINPMNAGFLQTSKLLFLGIQNTP